MCLHSAHRAVWGHLSAVRYSATPRPKDPTGWQRGCWIDPPPSLDWGPLSAPSPCREKTLSWSGQTLLQRSPTLNMAAVWFREMMLTAGSKAFTNSTGWWHHDSSDIMHGKRWLLIGSVNVWTLRSFFPEVYSHGGHAHSHFVLFPFAI